MAYEIAFAATAKSHLRSLRGHDRALIVSAIETHLSNEPLVKTRNRKRLRPNPVAPWELRVGNFRIFYEVNEPAVVAILAIAVKRGNTLYIEGEEIQL